MSIEVFFYYFFYSYITFRNLSILISLISIKASIFDSIIFFFSKIFEIFIYYIFKITFVIILSNILDIWIILYGSAISINISKNLIRVSRIYITTNDFKIFSSNIHSTIIYSNVTIESSSAIFCINLTFTTFILNISTSRRSIRNKVTTSLDIGFKINHTFTILIKITNKSDITSRS